MRVTDRRKELFFDNLAISPKRSIATTKPKMVRPT